MWRKSPSAIWLRAELPVQSIKTRLRSVISYFLSWGTRTARASFGSEGSSQRNNAVAKNAPPNCARMKAGASVGLMPANVSLIDLAKVTAGFANEVEAVNQYAAVMYAATANGTAADRNRTQPQITASTPNLATNSLKTCAAPARTC